MCSQFCTPLPDAWTTTVFCSTDSIQIKKIHTRYTSNSRRHVLPPSFTTPSLTCCACISIRKPATGGQAPAKPLVPGINRYWYLVLFNRVQDRRHQHQHLPGTCFILCIYVYLHSALPTPLRKCFDFRSGRRTTFHQSIKQFSLLAVASLLA